MNGAVHRQHQKFLGRMLARQLGRQWKSIGLFDSAVLPCGCITGNCCGVPTVFVAYCEIASYRQPIGPLWLVVCGDCRSKYYATGNGYTLGGCLRPYTEVVPLARQDAA